MKIENDTYKIDGEVSNVIKDCLSTSIKRSCLIITSRFVGNGGLKTKSTLVTTRNCEMTKEGHQ